MDHSLYHVYADAIWARDLLLLGVAGGLSVFLLDLWTVAQFRPIPRITTWIIAGVFYASLLATAFVYWRFGV